MKYLVIRDEHGERREELNVPVVSVGRNPDCSIILTDKQCSRNHCRIEWDGEVHKLVDLGSRNGTRVNEEVVNAKSLESWDRIRIGKAIIILADPERPDPREGVGTGPSSSTRRLTPDETQLSESAYVRRRRRRPVAGRRSHGEQEKLILTLVIGGASLLLLMVGLLVLFGSNDGYPAGYHRFERLVSRAERDWHKDPEYWQGELSAVPASMGKVYKRARALSLQIGREIEEHRLTETKLEKERFDEIMALRRYMGSDPDTLRTLCLVFLERHPSSANQPQVAAVLGEAVQKIRERAEVDPRAFRRELSGLLQRKELGEAARLLENAIEKMDDGTSSEAGLLNAREEIRSAADRELERIARETGELSPEMTSAMYGVLLTRWGDGRIELLSTHCEMARKAAAERESQDGRNDEPR